MFNQARRIFAEQKPHQQGSGKKRQKSTKREYGPRYECKYFFISLNIALKRSELSASYHPCSFLKLGLILCAIGKVPRDDGRGPQGERFHRFHIHITRNRRIDEHRTAADPDIS